LEHQANVRPRPHLRRPQPVKCASPQIRKSRRPGRAPLTTPQKQQCEAAKPAPSWNSKTSVRQAARDFPMQRWAALAVAVGLTACSPEAPDSTPMPDVIVACKDAWTHIDVRIRQSPRLQKVETLVCYYGIDHFVTKSSCSIPVDIDEIGRSNGENDYGLKDNTVAAIIFTSTYDVSIGGQWITYHVNFLHEIEDTDICNTRYPWFAAAFQ
jgi:hypothetical protein